MLKSAHRGVMVSRVRLALCACVALAAAAIARAVDTHVFYYNDVTRESRWDDPESLATHLDDTGRPYWVDADTGESTYDSPKHSAWHAVVSEDDASAGRVYYIHKETQETTWEKPEELAWRRIEQEVDAHDKWQREQAQGEKDGAKTSRSTEIPSTSVRTKSKASAAPTRTL